jgi:predicted enzyme related to lactoylglutathione lyase
MPARKKASKKSAAKKRAPARKRPAAKKAAKKVVKKKTAAKAPARQAQPAAPPSPPSGIGLLSQHMDYTTHNLADVKRFYTDLLGFRRFEQDPQMNYLYVQTGHSSSVGFMPPMQGMGEPSPAKEPTLYFMVKDVDRAYTDLSAKGVQFEGPPADMPWGHRVVSTIDPEGRRVMIATAKRRV